MKSCTKNALSLINLKKGDIIICIALLLFSVLGLFLPAFHAGNGAMVVVSINGISYTEVSLSKDQTVEIKGNDDSVCNIIAIQDGQARMLSATCLNQVCVRQSSISATNETIICLPNKVIIEVTSSIDNQIDSVSE